MLASDIARIVGGRLLGEDKDLLGFKPLFYAKESHLSFILSPKDIRFSKVARAGCLMAELGVVADYADEIAAPWIVVEDFNSVFLSLRELVKCDAFLANRSKKIDYRSIDSTAKVHETALIGISKIGSHVEIGDHAIVKDGSIIDDDTIIGPGAVIYGNVFIGKGCHIGANSVIGSDGFVPYGAVSSVNLPSLGDVVIGDNVRIGSLCTVDRGLLGTTRISNRTLMDNMVHVGHDAEIGENVVIAAQSGLAGFVRIGNHVTMGGQVGVVPYVLIHEGARISGKSMVHCDIKPYEIWSGNPSVPHHVYLRAYGRLMNKGKNNVGARA